MEDFRSIEKLFNDDCRQKKREGRGIYNRASRLGYMRGGVKFPSDFLSAKERKKMNGEVVVRSLYEDINNLPKDFEEVRKMDAANAKMLLKGAKLNHTVKKLTTYWGISVGKLYIEYEKHGIYKRKEGKGKATKKAKTTSNNEVVVNEVQAKEGKSTTANTLVTPIEDVVVVETESKETPVVLNTQDSNMTMVMLEMIEKLSKRLDEKESSDSATLKEGVAEVDSLSTSKFSVNIEGEYNKFGLHEKLMAILPLLVDGNKYNLSISIEEK